MEIDNFRGEIEKNEPMSRHTSYAIGGPADLFASPVDRDDLICLIRALREQQVPFFVLGGGTNLLVRDGGFRGAVISLRHMKAITTEQKYRSIGGSFITVAAEAGAGLGSLLVFAAEHGLTGLEFAVGIPGTVGGAVCMNAGTALGEMSDVVESVTLISPEGDLVTRNKEEMGFGYRTSWVPEGHVILEVRIALRRDDKAKIREQYKKQLDLRRESQPSGLPNAGSVFKNPMEESAGRLIEAAGLKGRKVGGAQVSEKHANFIVNLGKAKATDVLELMEIIKQKVLERHRVRLEPEIKVIGED